MLLSRPDVPRPSQSARDKAKSLLDERLGASKVLTGKDACERFVRDESEAEGEVPDAVVLATSSEDILKALAVARETEVPITPRAGGTGRTGGAVPMAGGIVLATSGMNQIVEIDRKEGVAVVEPGVILADFHAAVEAEGWFYPPDPNSLKSCALGGNVAENAGGPRAFKYGVTRDYVLGVEAFLVGGQRIRRAAHDQRRHRLRRHRPARRQRRHARRLRPNHVAADPEAASRHDTADLIQRRELPAKPCRRSSRPASPRAASSCSTPPRSKPCAWPETRSTAAGAMLLMEVDGDEGSVERQAERISGVCDDVKALEVLVAQDEAQRERLWSARRDMSHAVRKLTKKKLSEDVVVPRQQIGNLLDSCAKLASAPASARSPTATPVTATCTAISYGTKTTKCPPSSARSRCCSNA